MNFEYIAQQLINGLILGSLYALVAVGFSMIYGIIRLINFAHGEIIMIGAFTTLGLLSTLGLPFWLVIPAVILVCAGTGIIIEKAAFRPMRGAPQVTGFIASLGVSIMLQNLGILLLTAQPRNFSIPAYAQKTVKIGSVTCQLIDIVIIITAPLFMVMLMVIVNKTRLGRGMRATAENLDVARLMGVNVNRTIALTFAFGAGLAGFAGLMWGGKFGQIDPLMGFVPGLKSFIAAVIGGVGSIPGAILGSYLLGMAEIWFVGFLPPVYSSYRDAFVFGLLIIVLLILPNGLLGKNIEERA
ncbi:branched-chain amino acid ABC transporter permease [bacterium]|nr:branched-chain amino acid ABC transporter permease [bacterium]